MSLTSGPTRGITLMMIGTLMLTVQDAVSKWLITDFTVGEILVYRGAFAYLPLAWFIWRDGGWLTVRSRRPRANVVRALLNTGAGFTVISAYAFLPLADVLAVLFASPIIVTALSVPLLRESVGWRRWTAVIIGFVGVLIILRPGSQISWYFVLPVFGAVFVAFRDILTRTIGSVDSSTTILLYTVSVSMLGGLATFPFVELTSPNALQWAVFASMGLVNGVAHYCTIKAFTFASVSTLAPLRYFALVWAAIIGYLVWNDTPTQWTLLGTALVVASGVFIILRERRVAALTEKET